MQYLKEFLAGDLQKPLTCVFFSEDWDFGVKRFLNDGAGEIRLVDEGAILFRANGTLGETPVLEIQDMVFSANPPRPGVPAKSPNIFARCGADLVSGTVGKWSMTERHNLEGSVSDGHGYLKYLAFKQLITTGLAEGTASAYAVFEASLLVADFLNLFPGAQAIRDNLLGDCQQLFTFTPDDSAVGYALLLQDDHAWVRIQVEHQFEEQISWHCDALLDALSFVLGETVKPLAMFTRTSTADITEIFSRSPSLENNRFLLPPVRVFPIRGADPITLMERATEYFFVDGLKIIRHLKGWWSASTCYPEVQAAALLLVLRNIGSDVQDAVDDANLITSLAQVCGIQLALSPTEGVMQEIESLEFTKAITKSIDAQFVMERMQHLYVIIQFLYNVVLSRFGYACSYAYPNVLARELSQANNVQG